MNATTNNNGKNMNSEQVYYHSATCPGHTRAQRFALQSCCRAAYEREKAAIKSYEDGWDRWDGPIWPLDNNLSVEQELHWEGCCPVFEGGYPAIAEPAKLQVPMPRPGSSASGESSPGMWHSRPVTPCPSCGRPTGM